MPHKRETQWSATYISQQGLLPNLDFGLEGHFRRENLTSCRSGHELTTSRTPKLHNKQGVPCPIHLAIGYQCKQSKDLSNDLTQVYTNFMSILKCYFINPIIPSQSETKWWYIKCCHLCIIDKILNDAIRCYAI